MAKPPIAPPRAPSADDLLRAGLQLHQSGRAQEAASYYRRVMATDPKHPAANHLLGLVLLGSGDTAQAVNHIARAVAERPDNAQYLCNLGVALNAASRPEEAVAALERAVAINPNFAEAYSNLGMAFRELRRFDDAVEAYRRAIAIRPGEAGFHYNLANSLGSAGDIVPAERSYREALRLRPGHPAATNAFAGMLDEQGRYQEGLDLVDAALGISANDALLHLRRARLLEHMGRLGEAVAGYDRTLVLRPGFGEAHHHRANLMRHRDRDAALAAMESLFRNEGTPPDDRIFAGFGLGKALADIGEHDDSVETFLTVNRMHRERTPFVLDKAKADLAADLDREAGVAAEQDGAALGPIFIVGLPRAGKSTIEAILSRHPDVAPVRELPTLNRLYKNLSDEYPGTPLREIPRSRLAQLGHHYLAEARRIAADDAVTVDTMPSNYRLIGVIRAALPGARIVWCERRPTDHIIAILEKYLTGFGHEYANDPDELVAFHAAYRQAMEGWRTRLPGAIHFVDVAELRRDRPAQTLKLLEFCGLRWDEACLADVQSEPQFPAWEREEADANRAAHLAAWQRKRPDLFGDEAAKDGTSGLSGSRKRRS